MLTIIAASENSAGHASVLLFNPECTYCKRATQFYTMTATLLNFLRLSLSNRHNYSSEGAEWNGTDNKGTHLSTLESLKAKKQNREQTGVFFKFMK